MNQAPENAARRLYSFDRRAHPCGCVTVFDLDTWQSFHLAACSDHRDKVTRRAHAI